MSVTVSINSTEVVRELDKVSGRQYRRLRTVIQDAGQDLQDEWRKNATESSGAHGVHYPESIKSRMTGALEATVEPQEGMKQAGMSWEYGSRNQPPHLDGTRAADRYAPLIARRIEAALSF